MTLGPQILELFNDPTSVWLRVFDTHLDDLAKRTFLTLATLPSPADLEDLESVVRAQAATAAGIVSLDPTIKALDDTFISINRHADWTNHRYERAERAVSYRNPGLLDFAQAQLERTPVYLEVFEPLGRFEQVQELVDLAFAAQSGGKPSFPRLRKFVTEHGARYLESAVRLYSAAPTTIGGLVGLDRDRALIGIATRFPKAAGSAYHGARAHMADRWTVLMQGPVALDVAQFLTSRGVADFLRQAVGTDPVAAYAALAEGEPNLTSMEVLEELRRAQELAVDEANVRDEFGEYMRQRLEDLGGEDDRDSLRDEFARFEELSYWLDDETFAEAMGAYEERLGELPAEEDQYEEDEDRSGGRGQSAPTQVEHTYFTGLFGALRDR